MELRIRQAINKNLAKLVVVNPDEISLSSKAHRTLHYPPERFADMCRALASALRDSGSGDGSPAATQDEQNMRDLVGSSMVEGPFAVIYDDSFIGVADKGDAISALASVVEALKGIGIVGTLPLLDDCNSMGARDLNVLPLTDTGASWGVPLVQQLMAPGSLIRAAFVLGANLVKGEPVLAETLRGLDLLVVQELFLTDTAKLADVILPAASFAEKLGTFTNTERRVQAITETVPAPGIARADWEILVDLSQYLDRPLSYTLPAEIWAEIAAEVPAYSGLSLSDIGRTGARPRLLQPA
jgi:predicted molibdopterin-dependent oxidoreductase YjgC